MQAVARAVAQLPAEKLALGIPFYARHMQTGEWKTYTELLRSHGDTLSARTDEVRPSVICLVRIRTKRVWHGATENDP
jgi:GH18 family chitinase